jgi:hypothetical protein
MTPDSFPPEIHESLGYYVYRLIDPRNGQTFYVGKGRGDRIFSHAKQQLSQNTTDQPDDDDDESLKLQTIGEIRRAGLEVLHVIHRHGMDEQTSFEVEAALIEAYPVLTNMQGGHGNQERGCAHTDELITKYQLEEAPLDDQFIAININRSIEERMSIYTATNWCWKIAEWRAVKNTPVVAHTAGIIRGVFEVDYWCRADDPSFQSRIGPNEDLEQISKRWGFHGHPAREELQAKYMKKRLPKAKKGHASPLRFMGPEWKLE